jgi:hypothetical protein
VEALARHLVEEDSFTVAIHDAAKDSTVRFWYYCIGIS